jgi:cell cycle sensor histidine kinase DivJ
MLPQKQRQRLRIIHLGWLAMVVAVACSVLVSREREALSFAWLGLAALPGLAGYLLLGPDRLLNQFAPSFLVITWTVFAAFALALSGAAMSPLAVLFVIAPLVALNLGNSAWRLKHRFSGQGPISWRSCCPKSGFCRWERPFRASPASPGCWLLQRLSPAPCWSGISLAGRNSCGCRETRPPLAEVSHPAKATIPVPADSGVLLLDVTPDGMIRGADGDRLGLPAIGAGTLLRDVLDARPAGELLARLTMAGRGETLANGRKVAFCATSL